MTEIRVGTFNVENLFARFKFKANIDPLEAVKDGWNAEATAFDINGADAKRITGQAIKATGADILALQEVENLDTLKRFRSEYLGGFRSYEYAVAVDGNDPRLIDVAVLSRYPIVHVRSYAHLRTGRSQALFSRDCLEVDVLVGKKLLTLFVQHYKSMMGGRDATHDRRKLQVEATLEIIKDRFGRSAGREPFVVLGDFNDYMQTDDEGSPAIGGLVEWGQVENVLGRLPKEEQWTHYWDKAKKYSALDYLLPSRTLADASSKPPVGKERSPAPSRPLQRAAAEGRGRQSPQSIGSLCPRRDPEPLSRPTIEPMVRASSRSVGWRAPEGLRRVGRRPD